MRRYKAIKSMPIYITVIFPINMYESGLEDWQSSSNNNLNPSSQAGVQHLNCHNFWNASIKQVSIIIMSGAGAACLWAYYIVRTDCTLRIYLNIPH